MFDLLAIHWNVNPVIVQFGAFGIRWYSLLFVGGFILGWYIFRWFFRREGIPEKLLDPLLYTLLIATIVGARLGHCLFYEWHLADDPMQIFAWTIPYRNPYIENPFAMLKIWEGGLSSHGGAFGLIFAAWLLNRKHFAKEDPQRKTSLVWIFDRLVIGVCITGALIRLGNLMNSEIYGNPTTLPWGFIFVRDGQTEPCHPTQIYEALYCLIAFVLTWLMYWKGKCYERRGLIFGTFLLIVFVTRFVLEFIKFNQEEFEQGMLLNMGQILSIPFIIWGIYLIVKACRNNSLS